MNKDLFKRIADLCVQVGDTTEETDEKMVEILNQCDKLAELIDDYFG